MGVREGKGRPRATGVKCREGREGEWEEGQRKPHIAIGGALIVMCACVCTLYCECVYASRACVGT